MADKFMDEVNNVNNAPRYESRDDNTDGTQNSPAEAFSKSECTVADLKNKCMELSWPLLKKSTRINYEFFFSSYLLPAFGDREVTGITTMELQVFFNSLLEKLSPYTICNMHAALRSAFAQAITWDLMPKNPAIGVRLPKKKASKPPQLLSLGEIKAVIEKLPAPTKAIVTLIVFGSMRVGEALALRWNDILEDRIVIDERLYDGDLADPKTLHGNREVPFDQHGVLKEARDPYLEAGEVSGGSRFRLCHPERDPDEAPERAASSEGCCKGTETAEGDRLSQLQDHACQPYASLGGSRGNRARQHGP